MKSYLIIAALVLSSFVYSQVIPQNLNVAVRQNMANTLLPVFNPHLSFYSKNYNEIFGMYNYTFNTLNLGVRDVYVADNKLYYNASHLFITQMPLGGLTLSGDYHVNQFYPLGGIITLLGGKEDLLSFKTKRKHK